MHSLKPLIVVFALFLCAACSDDASTDGGGDVDASTSDPDASNNGNPDAAPGTADAAVPPGFVELIDRDWSLNPGSENYRCTRVTIERDMYVNAFRAMDPLGTHHTVLSVRKNSSQPDGDYNCNAGDIAHAMLFASGVGTDELALPEGVAIKLEAGDQLDLNLHLYNVSDAQLTGTSGTLVREIPANEVVDEAEVVFGGQYAIFLQSQPGVEQTINGGCTFNSSATVVALWPHMHQLGRHMRVVHESNGGNTTLLDTAFDFNEQLNYPIAPVQVNAGERLDVDCTYINDTGSIVTFGDSSSQEMCFVGIYRYPATNAGVFDCVETF